MGAERELKRALESYWSGTSTAEALHRTAGKLRTRHWTVMKDAGLDEVPVNDFSLYDHMLDTMVLVGAVPARYRHFEDPLERYFAMARGYGSIGAGTGLPALEMTKWFDTNYHYLVPEIAPSERFSLDAAKLLNELEEARVTGVVARPVVVGPVTFLLLSKLAQGAPAGEGPLDALDDLIAVYAELLSRLAEAGINTVQIDEPCLVLDLPEAARHAYRLALARLGRLARRPRLTLATYFGALDENLELALESGWETLHIDLVRGREQLPLVLSCLPSKMGLSLGVVDGRNVWRTDLDAAHTLVHSAVRALGEARVTVSSSCSLLHVPLDLELETGLDAELRSWLVFAQQKLGEIRVLAGTATMDVPNDAAFSIARAALQTRRASPRTRNERVRARAAAVEPSLLRRGSPYVERRLAQAANLDLPSYPTTTIGSFPQTPEVRRRRAAWRQGTLDEASYDAFLQSELEAVIRAQEDLGLDVLVHGEFERNDMVEYFGEMLEGFAFSQHGWVQSYGSRCVKPPILFGDVARTRPMTVEWARRAQALTRHPVKGMLTGPVTILQWSFARDDQPRGTTCQQIALALRDEVHDLEHAGLRVIQVDEPAIREGLPLRHADWPGYLGWAVDCFRLTTSGVADETQIHTHMCYAEFGDIMDAIAAMDADVLSIETSRSRMELLKDFGRFAYPNEIGPGVYDIHSPRVPSVDEMVSLLVRAREVIPAERLWVNPDCGLKTRGWREAQLALRNLVAAARRMRTGVTE